MASATTSPSAAASEGSAASSPPSTPEQLKKRSSTELGSVSDDSDSEGRRVRQNKDGAAARAATTEQPPSAAEEQPAAPQQARPVDVQASLPPHLDIPNQAKNPGLYASVQDLLDLANKILNEVGTSIYPCGKEPKGRRQYARAYKQRNPSHSLPPDLKLLYILDSNGSRLWHNACKRASKLDSDDHNGLLKNPLAWYHKEVAPEGDIELLYTLMLRLIVQLQYSAAHADDEDELPTMSRLEHWLNAYKLRIITPDGRPIPLTLGTLHQAFPDAKDIRRLTRRATYFCDYNPSTKTFSHKPHPETEDRIEDLLLKRGSCRYHQLAALFPVGAESDFVRATIHRLATQDYTTKRWISRSIRIPPMSEVHTGLNPSGITLDGIMRSYPDRVGVAGSFRNALHEVAYPEVADKPSAGGICFDWDVEQTWYPKMPDTQKGGYLSVGESEKVRQARMTVWKYPEFFPMKRLGVEQDRGCQTDQSKTMVGDMGMQTEKTKVKNGECQTEVSKEKSVV